MKGKVWVNSFTDESVVDHQYEEARKKIEVVIHPEWPTSRVDARAPVTIALKDGRKFSKELDTPREPTMEELFTRYREAADGVLTSDQTEKSLDLLLKMENLKDVSEVMNLLVFRM